MIENFITVTEALQILKICRSTLCEWCDSGKIVCRKIPDKSKNKFHWEISKDDCMKKSLEKSGHRKEVCEIEKRQEDFRERTQRNSDELSDEEINQKISALHLSQNESERLKVTLRGFSKAEAERVLKTEQALSKQKDNVLRDGQYVQKDDVAEQIGIVFSSFSKSLKDLISVWQRKFSLSPESSGIMQADLQKCIGETIARMRV